MIMLNIFWIIRLRIFRLYIWMRRISIYLFQGKKGRSKKGNRSICIATGSKGSNIHLIRCIGNIGLIHHEIRRGSFKKPEAMEFIRNCLRKAQNNYASHVVMVIDNASCHGSIEEVFKENEFENHRLLRLEPYSPMLNDIEYTWSHLKSSVKKDLAIEIPNILAGEGKVDMAQTEFRLQQLENIIKRNISVITVSNCARNVAHVQRFKPYVLNMENVTF